MASIQSQYRKMVSYETLKNFVGLVKNSEYVMPDLIRHPEFADVTGFRPLPA